ncbi:hypothetical protein D1627_06625 [Pontibacter oryzae]|uniref:Uncharacterized protein n=1 Tax=Pontibacter oryzae TaxID=2304593 RepID=A0A399SIX5_9BACT|nr:hypothetical protein D1627_06625 [Pontibacter oryzae]
MKICAEVSYLIQTEQLRYQPVWISAYLMKERLRHTSSQKRHLYLLKRKKKPSFTINKLYCKGGYCINNEPVVN